MELPRKERAFCSRTKLEPSAIGRETQQLELRILTFTPNSMQRMGASRSAQLQSVRQRRLAASADAER